MADGLVKIFPGIEEMLGQLRQEGYKVGVVTSRTKDSTLFYMEKFGISHYFDAIVSCDDTGEHKPNPQPLLLGLEKLGAKAEEAVMVGDSSFDIRCANNAGVKSVLVDWRITGGDDKLQECKIDYQLKKPMDMLALLEEVK